MISYIKGILAEKNPTSIVIETGGIGYQIEIPLSSFDAMGETGDEIVILTYLHVREDKMTLYGFATEKERKIFRLLIGISGVGPKLAQGILSGISANDLVEAITDMNIPMLTSAPGVGRKTAERIILELKDKVGSIYETSVKGFEQKPSSVSREAVLALVSLGYNENKAQKAVNSIVREEPELTLEDVLKKALRNL